MSLLISNKTKSLIPRSILIDNDDYFDDLVGAGEVVPVGWTVYVKTATRDFVIQGMGQAIDDPEPALVVPDPPETGDYVLESEDGVLTWVAKTP